MITTHKLIIFLTTLMLSLHFFLSAEAKECSPSACGAIRDISSPFRLKSDPRRHCGDPTYELTCENNVTFIYLNSVKYHVKHINYQNDTIRFVDASINNDICSFPVTSTYAYNFTAPSFLPYYSPSDFEELSVNLISCPNPLKNPFPFIDITQYCDSNSSYPSFRYVNVGHIMASELPHLCELDLMEKTSWPGFEDLTNVSLSQIHQSLLYGFELYFCNRCDEPPTLCEHLRYRLLVEHTRYLLIPMAILVFIIAGVSLPVTIIIGIVVVLVLSFTHTSFWENIRQYSYYYQSLMGASNHFAFIALLTEIIVWAPRIIICPLIFWFFIYKFRRRQLSLFEGVESFLKGDNKLVPIRYSYSDLKKMTKNFEGKLGQGGFGSVYKGKLRSGHLVAVKLLEKSAANGQDFINEIATIGRIHHVNIVQLVGYCAERSKRALIFDFMPNGSLDKYVSNREEASSLDWDMKFKIAVEVARGIEYLHHGCDIQILHFDIKPHNILLDEKFVPKISDFGLAKLCPSNKEAVTLTAARGTIGYVAPELINRSFGTVSYKADVYSFGMLLMEMVNLNKDLTWNNDESSKYFPNWIYDHLNQGSNIDIGNVDENDDRNIGRKMTIIALWCIQMNPDNRPSMNKVLKMSEGDVEHMQTPNYPTYTARNEEESWTTDSNASLSLLHDDNSSSIIEIISNA
ncbi:LEAF RUST 10 DISEASE-RESISTANCE LOCUS RECEPTOR-LIKE PROTEIN KINASE-like 2.1 isoform X2 [Salvia hispanica]|uniref:LEAF RUST 10 DISEASE-RESISTANCE LOCUS RECEPTOR-LIKE PROTEIN KINASE-like 2.1 isoform X2 n=1 Tax=Salvia hispanica TaxID=49212 RepID=UPI0020093182|nr:LEAF RUST 10 DISEASE-RESISTANCE LOCUS RECEPTOR-LIKE PROTEIN KINASE-like 2.1 isoform X2 [Salvia hispanica]